VWPEQTFCS